MRYEQVSHDRLKSLRMGADAVGMDRGNNHTSVGDASCMAAVTTNNSEDARARRLGEIECRDEIWAHVSLEAASSHGEHQDCVAGLKTADTQPCFENGRPAFVVNPRG